MSGSEWVTYTQAAELLGVHPSAIAKMVRRGDLTRRDSVPALSRVQVVEFAAARVAAAAELERRRTAPKPPPEGPQPPDNEHVWLDGPAAAAVVGCTVGALRTRAGRGQVPCVFHNGRRWFRLDHLELVVRARSAAVGHGISRVEAPNIEYPAPLSPEQ